MTAPLRSEAEAIEVETDALLRACRHDPLKYVRAVWPWKKAGTPLEHESGPKPWQAQFLRDLGAHTQRRGFNGRDPVQPVKMAISSGVGPGKTALLAWVLHWLMDTRPDCKCRVTANTATQLETVTWAEVQKWGQSKLTADRWTMMAETMYATGDRVNWFAVRTTCAPENAQAFAGWHNRRSATANFYDEGGTIPEEIFEKGRGIEVDGEPFQFIFGQCSRRNGQLHRAVFGSERDSWDHRVIDGYEVVTSDVVRTLYREWEETYGGPDSDFCRVHIRGLPPNADELQFIGGDVVYGAQTRVADALPDEPLVCGVDVSGGGSAWTVCWFRHGPDARSIPPIRITGERSRDRQHVVSMLAQALQDHQPHAMFIDSAFGAVIVQRLNDLGFGQVYETNFGGPSPDEHQANQRAYQWQLMKDWLKRGAIPAKDERLANDLTGPGFHLNAKNKLVLESKESMQKRGIASPDSGDALSLTFAQPVTVSKRYTMTGWSNLGTSHWSGLWFIAAAITLHRTR